MPKRRANGEGSIYQRKDGRWCAQYTDVDFKTRVMYGKTQREVKDKLKEIIRQLDAGMSVDGGKMTLAAWLVEWLETYSRPMVQASTFANYHRAVHHRIIPAFPTVKMKDLRPEQLQRFFNGLATTGKKVPVGDGSGRWKVTDEGYSSSVMKGAFLVLKLALNKAVEFGYIMRSPLLGVKIPRKPKTAVKVLTADEQKRIEAVIREHHNPLAFAILFDLYTGLRVGELAALKISDIEFEKQELYVRRSRTRVDVPGSADRSTEVITKEPKTESGRRRIPLPIFLVDMLKEHLERRSLYVNAFAGRWDQMSADDRAAWTDEGYIFLSVQGKPTDRSNLALLLDSITEQAGVDHIKFHALRHTFATRCLEAGFDVRSLADILGHANASTTLNIYAHALDEQKRQHMGKLSALYEG